MKRLKGFTLIELMVAMSIGLSLLTALMTFWLALSKNSHKEILKLELSQDYLEIVSYLRPAIGRAIFQPHCMNPEWVQYKAIEHEHPMVPFVSRNGRMMIHQSKDNLGLAHTIVMQDAALQYPELILNDYKLRTLVGSDLIELVTLTPLSVEEGIIQNADELKGNASGYIYATDCRQYVLGRYHKSGLNQYRILDKTQQGIMNHLSQNTYVQYYKVSRSFIYMSYEQNRHYLIHNFLDGSNHMRFPNIQGMKVKQSEDHWQLLAFDLLLPMYGKDDPVHKELYIRLLNL